MYLLYTPSVILRMISLPCVCVSIPNLIYFNSYFCVWKKDKHEKMFKIIWYFLVISIIIICLLLPYCQAQQKITVVRQLTGDIVSNNIDCPRFYGRFTSGICECQEGSFFTSCLYSREIRFHTGKYVLKMFLYRF